MKGMARKLIGRKGSTLKPVDTTMTTIRSTANDTSLPLDYISRSRGLWASVTTVPAASPIRNLVSDKDFTASTKPASTQHHAMTSRLVPQHLYDVLPSEHRDQTTNVLSNKERSYYLCMFRAACHPLIRLLSARDFDELVDASLATMLDLNPSTRASADIVIALFMQHVHATGLAGRVLGVYQSTLGQQAPPGYTTWSGFSLHKYME
jgi:hypothetical protein